MAQKEPTFFRIWIRFNNFNETCLGFFIVASACGLNAKLQKIFCHDDGFSLEINIEPYYTVISGDSRVRGLQFPWDCKPNFVNQTIKAADRGG
jgi:hypothetical protein